MKTASDTARDTVRKMLRDHPEPLGSLLAKRGIRQIASEVEGISEFCEDNGIDGKIFSEIKREMRETDLFHPVLELIRTQRVPLELLEDMLADERSIRDICHEVKGLREFCNKNGIDRKMLSEIVVWMSKKMGSDVLNVRRASAKLATSTPKKSPAGCLDEEEEEEEDLSGLLKKANVGRYDDDDDVLNVRRASAKVATPTRKSRGDGCLEENGFSDLLHRVSTPQPRSPYKKAKNGYDLLTPRPTAKGRKNANQIIDQGELPDDFKRYVQSPGATKEAAMLVHGAALNPTEDYHELIESLRVNKGKVDMIAKLNEEEKKRRDEDIEEMMEAARKQLDKQRASQAKEEVLQRQIRDLQRQIRDLEGQLLDQQRQTKKDGDDLKSMSTQIDDALDELKLVHGRVEAFCLIAKNLRNVLISCFRAADSDGQRKGAEGKVSTQIGLIELYNRGDWEGYKSVIEEFEHGEPKSNKLFRF